MSENRFPIDLWTYREFGFLELKPQFNLGEEKMRVTTSRKKVISLMLALVMLSSTWTSTVEVSANEYPAEIEADKDLTVLSDSDDAVTYLAQGECGAQGDNIVWTMSEDGTLTITGSGEMANYTASTAPWKEYLSTIKSVAVGEGVTAIGDYSFKNCTVMTSASLASSVTEVGKCAFEMTTMLKDIDLSHVVTFGVQAFNQSAVESVNLSSVTTIGKGTFLNCKALTLVELGDESDRTIKVGESAFQNSTGLTTVDFKNPTEIIKSAFNNTGLVEVDLSNVTSLGASAFRGTSNLKTVIWGDLQTIPASCFYGSGLTSFEIASNVTSIGNYAFAESALTEITIPTDVKTIGNFAFSGSALTEITIPSTVETFGVSVFMGCKSLKAVTIEEGLETITGSMFSNCISLTKIVIPKSVTAINSLAFQGCTSLTEIAIPESIIVIEEQAFQNCSPITVNYEGTEEAWNRISIGTDNTALATINYGKSTEPTEITGIVLDKETITMSVGESLNLTATIQPLSAAPVELTWISSNQEVASVENGLVVAVGVGSATIRVSVGSIAAECFVTVQAKQTDTLTPMEFTYIATSGNQLNDGFVEANVIDQADGSYYLSLPVYAAAVSGASLTIKSPEKYEGQFSITYFYYESNVGVSDPLEKTVYSNDGVVVLDDYFAARQTYVLCSDLKLTIDDKEYTLILKPYAELSSISITNSSEYEYPVKKINSSTYSVEVLEGETVKILISSLIGGNMLSNNIYIDDELQEHILSYTVSDEIKIFNVRLEQRKDTYGIDSSEFSLVIKPTTVSHVPVIKNYTSITSLLVDQNDELSFSVDVENVDENTIFEWKNISSYIGEKNSRSLTVDTSVPKYLTFYCEVTNIVDGISYTVRTADINVSIKASSIDPPVYTTQPVSAQYSQGEAAIPLTVEIKNMGYRYTYTYQWYSNITPEVEGGTPISNATGKTYTPATDIVGTTWYYCEVHASYTFRNEQGAWVIVTSPSAVSEFAEIKTSDAKIDLKGTGTAEDPFLITSYEELKTIRDKVNGGSSFAGICFRFENNIELGEDWTPIGCTVDGTNKVSAEGNLHAFCGILDGNGKKVTVYPGGLPLFNYVNGATIKNLNIYGTQINGYGLINEMHGVGLSGTSVVIDNVRILSGTNILKSGLLGGEIDGAVNGFAGVSAGYVAKISNCTIESGVTIGYDGTQTFIGSFAGRLQGTIENCVSYATVKGVSYVGGIIGSRDNAMGLCSVSGCSFLGSVIASGTHAGGIVGGGYSNSTAPNGIKVSVQNCNVSGSVTGTDKVGGILGGDSYVAQAWNEYSFTGNSFTGTVSGTGTSVGAIIGYYDSLNRIDNISGNTYSANCGASQGIGYVKYLDTSYENPTTMEGTVAFSTENGTSGCPTVTGCWWKAAHNRTDDPLGKDAAALCQVERSLGDLNGDGQVTNADVAALLAIITAGGEEDLSVADLNGDGVLSNADVAQLLQMITAA